MNEINKANATTMIRALARDPLPLCVQMCMHGTWLSSMHADEPFHNRVLLEYYKLSGK